MQQRFLIVSLVFISFFFSVQDTVSAKENKAPRQKIELLGLTLSGKPQKIAVDALEKELPNVSATILDPYNNNMKTTFTGLSFYDLAKKYATPEATKVFVKAIDGYSVETPIELMKTEKMIFAIKDQNGYLSIKRMGPARIIYPIKEELTKEHLLRIGLHWVWQVKSLEFKK